MFFVQFTALRTPEPARRRPTRPGGFTDDRRGQMTLLEQRQQRCVGVGRTLHPRRSDGTSRRPWCRQCGKCGNARRGHPPAARPAYPAGRRSPRRRWRRQTARRSCAHRCPKSMQGVMRGSTSHRASTSSSVPSWLTLPIVSGQRMQSLKPGLVAGFDSAGHRIQRLFQRSSRLCLPQEPEWKMTRRPPSALTRAQLCSR